MTVVITAAVEMEPPVLQYASIRAHGAGVKVFGNVELIWRIATLALDGRGRRLRVSVQLLLAPASGLASRLRVTRHRPVEPVFRSCIAALEACDTRPDGRCRRLRVRCSSYGRPRAPGRAGRRRGRGRRCALALGLRVDVAVGDFDSISAQGLAALERAGARLERHPPAKDATDLELALDVALAVRAAADPRDRQRRRACSTSCSGQLLLLASDAYRGVEIDALLGRASVHVVRRERLLSGRAGRVGLAVCAARARWRGHDRGPRLSAARRDARTRVESGRLERVRDRARRASRSSGAFCSPCVRRRH